MKVLCINTDGWTCKKSFMFGLYKKFVDVTGPSLGDINTIAGRHYNEGILFYELLEWPEEGGCGYDASEFIPLSEIDETEFERIKKQEAL